MVAIQSGKPKVSLSMTVSMIEDSTSNASTDE